MKGFSSSGSGDTTGWTAFCVENDRSGGRWAGCHGVKSNFAVGNGLHCDCVFADVHVGVAPRVSSGPGFDLEVGCFGNLHALLGHFFDEGVSKRFKPRNWAAGVL